MSGGGWVLMKESYPGGRSLFIDDYNLVPRLNGNGAVRREVGLVMMHMVSCAVQLIFMTKVER